MSAQARWPRGGRTFCPLRLAHKPYLCPVKRYFPLLVGLFFLLGALAAVLALVLRACQGHLTYSLDDTYIHLSIARHLVEQGVWGVSEGEYAPAGSSPLYIFLLAALGAWEYAPLVWNVLAGIGIIWSTDRLLMLAGASNRLRLIALGWIILASPLYLMMALGMEATVQAWITLGFLLFSSRELTQERPQSRIWQLYVLSLLLAFLTGAIRFEGAFVVGAVALGWLLRRRWALAALILLAGAAPAVINGLVSIAHGHHFLPNSIAIKSSVPAASTGALGMFIELALERFYTNAFMLHTLLALAAMTAWLLHRFQSWTRAAVLCATVFVATVGHMLFAEVAFYRYETYLLVAAFAGIALAFTEVMNIPPQPSLQREGATIFPPLKGGRGDVKLALLAGLAILVLPFATRTAFFTLNYPTGARNIYEQQVQMARFLHQHYPTASVAANDIGAITYFNRLRLLDMVGIASTPVAESSIASGEYIVDVNVIRQLAAERNVEIAVIYNAWVGPWAPKEWIEVATWTIQDNFICAHATVSFYATKPDGVPKLQAALKAYQPQLPSRVAVQYLPLLPTFVP